MSANAAQSNPPTGATEHSLAPSAGCARFKPVRFFCQKCGKEIWQGMDEGQKECLTVAKAEHDAMCSDCLLNQSRLAHNEQDNRRAPARSAQRLDMPKSSNKETPCE